jgi:hypothetical protein
MAVGEEPVQMTELTLNALKGWPQPCAVDYHTEFEHTVDGIVDPGTVVHLNEAGKYELGVGTLAVMPMFMFNGSHDPDVRNDGGDASTKKGVFIAINPTGQAMALVANGAYELVSTAFVTTDDYPPNTHLTSAISGPQAGLLKPGTVYTDTICGIVSRGVVDNGYGFDSVAFWPWYIPPGL